MDKNVNFNDEILEITGKVKSEDSDASITIQQALLGTVSQHKGDEIEM